MANENAKDLKELVNPVFTTAKACVQLDAAAGDEDSKRLLAALDFDAFGSGSLKESVPEEISAQVRQLFPAFTLLIESRFQAVNNLIESRPERQIADLPCGYTSRGIRLSRQGRIYYGFDLPAVIETLQPAVESIIGKNSQIRYCAVDATNYESLKAAFAEDARDLLFTTEGLLMYFNQAELEAVFSNIRRLLQEYGGSWVIVDRAYTFHDRELVAAAVHHDPKLVDLFTETIYRDAVSKADVRLNQNVLFDPDEAKARAFVSTMGFDVKEIPIADCLTDRLGSLGWNQTVDAEAMEVLKNMLLWELSVKADSSAEHAPLDQNLPFRVESQLRDGVFTVSVQGRLDTITAPELLQRFQEAGGGIEAIHVDVSRMPYVSSAGLRVLLMMYKSMKGSERFALTGVRDEVREILETTGFDQFLL